MPMCVHLFLAIFFVGIKGSGRSMTLSSSRNRQLINLGFHKFSNESIPTNERPTGVTPPLPQPCIGPRVFVGNLGSTPSYNLRTALSHPDRLPQACKSEFHTFLDIRYDTLCAHILKYYVVIKRCYVALSTTSEIGYKAMGGEGCVSLLRSVVDHAPEMSFFSHT